MFRGDDRSRRNARQPVVVRGEHQREAPRAESPTALVAGVRAGAEMGQHEVEPGRGRPDTGLVRGPVGGATTAGGMSGPEQS